ncbi:MAG: hypothetical protein KME16_09350 [Scytolyngbya sp. HA4215-MV1]|jgi:hypothetical protein|nr:hypothetical protein [Scytolyngbya sp. HA4215-MV1]
MLPILIAEQLVHPFKFCLEVQVCQGMRYDSEIYGLVTEFAPKDRLKAYQKACELNEQGLSVVATASPQRYAIWLNLRLPDAKKWLFSKSEILTSLPQ